MLAACLLQVHDTLRGGDHNMSELARRQKVGDDLLGVSDLDIESRRNNTTLVQAADQVHDNLATAVVIDQGDISNVPKLLHHTQKLDDHL